MRITTGVNEASHIESNAIDVAGKDAGIENIYAPFDGVIMKIWKNGNTVWLESIDKVLFADGTEDWATAAFTHDNDVNDLRVGQRVKQGDPFYQEGTAGNASGNHVHLEIAKGKFTGTGWYKNSKGYWVLNNSVPPWTAFWVPGDVQILNDYAYNWRKEDNVIQNRDQARRLYVAIQHRNAKDVSDKEADGLIGRDIFSIIDQWLDESSADGKEWHAANDVLGRAYPLEKQTVAELSTRVSELQGELDATPADTSGAEAKLQAIKEILGVK
jgi:hypothetical protein